MISVFIYSFSFSSFTHSFNGLLVDMLFLDLFDLTFIHLLKESIKEARS